MLVHVRDVQLVRHIKADNIVDRLLSLLCLASM